MGKTMYMISLIIFVDLLFITFWGATTSLQSIVWSWLLDPANFEGNLITIGLQALFSTIAAGAIAAVVVALSGAKTDTVLFAVFAAGTLYNVGKDFVFMFQEVSKINEVLAVVMMAPFIIMFGFMVIEWLRGKDGN